MTVQFHPRVLAVVAMVTVAVVVVVTYSPSDEDSISIDGSSTVFPIQAGVAELFQAEHRYIRVDVGVSGTGGGMKKFTGPEDATRIHICDASRPIKPKEAEAAAANGIEFIELPIAYDGLTVVVNLGNDFVDHLTIDELAHIFRGEDGAQNWNEVRDGFPRKRIECYTPGPDSGTFDYFSEAVTGKGNPFRAPPNRITFSEDDNVLVEGVAGDAYAIGFFGFAYFVQNRERVKAVPIVPVGGGAPVLPNVDTIKNGTYSPLSRPIFIYVSTEAAEEEWVDLYVHFLFERVAEVATIIGYVPFEDSLYAKILERYEDRVTGSAYADGSGTVEELFGQ